jgi:hypothetical protein
MNAQSGSVGSVIDLIARNANELKAWWRGVGRSGGLARLFRQRPYVLARSAWCSRSRSEATSGVLTPTSTQAPLEALAASTRPVANHFCYTPLKGRRLVPRLLPIRHHNSIDAVAGLCDPTRGQAGHASAA